MPHGPIGLFSFACQVLGKIPHEVFAFVHHISKIKALLGVNIYYILYIKAGWVCWLLSHLPAVHAT
jgi:hypothetical protein